MPGTPAVLLLVDHVGIAGPGRQVALLSAGLRPGFAPHVAAGAVPGEEVAPFRGVAFHVVPLAGEVYPAPDLGAVSAVRHLLVDTKAAILHTHSPKAGAVGRLTALGMSSPPLLVHSFHADDLAGHAAIRGINRHAVLELERRLARRTDVLVAPTPDLRDELLGLRIGMPEQYQVIPHGLDLEPYLQVAGDRGELRRALGVPGDVPLAGTIGPLAAAEDHLAVLRGIAAVPSVHLAVLGDGQLGPALRDAAAMLGIGERVHFLQAWHDAPGALADLDLVVCGRRDLTTPEPLVEALAAGRPVVAADSPATRSLVDERRGWLCPAGDAGAFAGAISEVIGRPVEAMTRAARGRLWVVEQHGKDRMVATHAAIYRGLLTRPARTRAPERAAPRLAGRIPGGPAG